MTRLFHNFIHSNSVNRRKIKFFNKWHNYTIQDKIYSVERLNLLILFNKYFKGVVIDFLTSIKNHIKNDFQIFMQFSLKKIVHNSQIQTMHKNLIYFENLYNHKLNNTLHAFYNMTYLLDYKKNAIIEYLQTIQSKKKHRKYIIMSKYLTIWKLTSLNITKQKILSRRPYYILLPTLDEISKRKFQFQVFSRLKQKFLWIYKLIQDKAQKFVKILEKLQKNLMVRIKEKFWRILKLKHFENSIKSHVEIRARTQFFVSIVSSIKFRNQQYNLKYFIQKLKTLSGVSFIFHYGLKLTKFVYVMNRRLKFYLNDFLKNIIRKIKNLNSTKTIDSQIIANTAFVNLQMLGDYDKKTKYLKLLRFKNYIHLLDQRKGIETQGVLLRKTFSYWKNLIIQEKISLLEEITIEKEKNGQLKSKLADYTESGKEIENKINDMTGRAEKCRNCKQLLEDDLMNTMNTITMPSLREDTIHKVNVIPSIQVRHLIPRDDASLSIRYNGSSIENPLIEEEFKEKFRNSIHRENINPIGGLIFSTNNSKSGNIIYNNSNENFVMDENTGGYEYYQYLEKTNDEIQYKLDKLEDNFSIKLKQITFELDELCREVESFKNRK